MREERVQLVHLDGLGVGGYGACGQSFAGFFDPVDDGLRGDADEPGGAPKVDAVHIHPQSRPAHFGGVAFLLGLMGVVAPTVLAMQALGAASVEPGAGLAGGGGTSRAGRSGHANIIGNSCAKLDTPF